MTGYTPPPAPDPAEYASDYHATMEGEPYTARDIAESYADQHTPEDTTFEAEVERLTPIFAYYLPA